MKYYLGVDSGSHGAFVVMDEDGIICHQWVVPMKGKEVDEDALCAMTYNLDKMYPNIVGVLETPDAIAGTAKSSMFKMGTTLGKIGQAMTCAGINYSKVHPKIWTKKIWEPNDIVLKPSETGKRMVKDTKATSFNAAKRLFPNHRNYFYGDNEKNTGRRTKVHDGIVDAILLAHYCKLINS